jgi:phage terminase small subunit
VADPQTKLKDKRQAFVDAYLGEARFNASEAARLAGYSKPGAEGHRLLKNADVRARIDDAVAAIAVSRDELLTLLADDARMTTQDIIRASMSANSAPAESSVISSLLGARTAARHVLAKHYGLLTEKVQMSGNIRREIVVRRPSVVPAEQSRGDA